MGRKAFDENIHFWPKVKKTNGCWIWSGYTVKGGYGMVSINRKSTPCHRFTYEKYKGKIPDGMTIDHLCVNPPCVNPDHLEAVTQYENNYRSPNYTGNKTHCKNGHEYTSENTYIRPNLKGWRTWRDCKKCISARSLKSYHKRKALL